MRLSGPARRLLLSPTRCVLQSERQQSSHGSDRQQSTLAQVAIKRSTIENTKISAIHSSPDNHALQVEWKDGKRGNFPYVWLRDCAVSERPADPNELHADLEPYKQTLDKEGTKVDIIWPPYLRAEYTADWLRSRAPVDLQPSSALLKGEYAELLNAEGGIGLWSTNNKPPIISENEYPTFEQIISDPQVARRSLISFLKYGVLRIHQAHDDLDTQRSIRQLMSKLGINGKQLEYNVRKRVAKEAVRLQTSCCEMEHIPEIVMIRYNEDGVGVDQLSDGFAVIRHLRKVHPVAFSSLVNNPLLYMSRMNKPLQAMHPAIKKNISGEVVQVIYNNEMRHPEEQTAPGEHSLAVYDAIRNMLIVAYKKDYRMDILPEKNGMLLINNHRIMHGRTGYATTSFDRANYYFWQCGQ